jgi:NAD(P)-dependent dehydrogenase (short-subunit alcohol dehydrogenase family)
MSATLEGKAVVVIGGGRGIGRAHALACAAEGARVLVNDLGCDVHGCGADPSVAAAVADAIRASGGEAIADGSDVAGNEGAARVVERAIASFGRLDGLIAAAGTIADRTVLKMDDALLERMIDVHVRGPFALTRIAARAMIDRGEGGSIVLHTAPVAFFGALRQSALGATGAAVTGLVRSAAIELRKHRVRVNAIAPTARTRTTEELPLFRGIAPDSLGPEFVGPLGAFLVSDLAAEVTGEIVGVAGARLYAFRTRETPGSFGDGAPLSVSAIAAAWAEITRA